MTSLSDGCGINAQQSWGIHKMMQAMPANFNDV
jgi:hypothetical protein